LAHSGMYEKQQKVSKEFSSVAQLQQRSCIYCCAAQND